MEVRSDRRYHFDESPEELWASITRVDDYRRWWPWLRSFEAASFEAGAHWSCVVQPPLPYSLRFGLHLDEVVPKKSVQATVTGDITGRASLEIAEVADGSELVLVSELAPANSMLRAVALVAAPVVRFGHDWVLDTGLRQFKAGAFS